MEKPAIILITCDELNKKALSRYGNEAIDTKYIDSLAEGGVDYENCYTVSPCCLPARCSILTGLYPHNNGSYSNFRQNPLQVGTPNLFQEMRRLGYHTTVFGKCHFAPVPYDSTKPDVTLPYDAFKHYYESLGIDHLALQDDKQVSVWFYDDYSKELEAAGYLKAYRDAVWNKENHKVFPFPAPKEWHPDIWVGRKAADYIRRQDPEQPFFTWISFSGPHYTFDAPEEYYGMVDREKMAPRICRDGEWDEEDRIQHDSYWGGKYSHIDGALAADGQACRNYPQEYWERLRMAYFANIKLIDDQVGEILKAVRERYGDNALIFFTADHGEMMGDHSLWGKHNCGYEQVWKVPFLAHYPREGRPAQKADSRLVNSTDILPTCVAAAGGSFTHCDGLDLQDPGWTRRYTFAEEEGYLAVTDGRLKYIHVQKGEEKGRELLDLEADPQEFDNRIGRREYAADLARLREAAIEHMLPGLLL